MPVKNCGFAAPNFTSLIFNKKVGGHKMLWSAFYSFEICFLPSVFRPLSSVFWPLSFRFQHSPSQLPLNRYRCNYLGGDEHPGDQRCVEYSPQVNFTRQLVKPGGQRCYHDQHTDDMKEVMGIGNQHPVGADKGDAAEGKQRQVLDQKE